MKEKKTPVQPPEEQNDILGDKPGKKDFLIIGIGASAGGIQALKDFFEMVPADSGMAYVVILHLSPDHDSQLAKVLQATASIPVMQVTEKVHVEKNHVYVVPPDNHLEMQDGTIIVSKNIFIEERRAPVDIFFRTLAESHGAQAVAVILSGTGANGSMGIKRIKEKGGVCFVQNPREAEFNEMPRNSIATGLVDDVLSVRDIPSKIIAYKDSLGKIKIPEEPVERPEEQQQALREIFTQLRVRTGHDFSNYKRPTLLRRIERRVNVRSLATLSEYAAFLHEHPEETQALLKDLLISVTNFFRDARAFEYIQQEVIPRILANKNAASQVRIWVAGCATGEEAYSLAMLFTEQLTAIDAPKVQIFATDIDEASIAAAREGCYTINDAADVSPERLHRFFTKEGDEFRVKRELREMVLFARHNAIKDPPFSHLDMVSCRNFLIYLNHIGQERLMETFHFALETGGYLMLGMSEIVDGSGDLYTAVNRECHVYKSRQTPVRMYPIPESVPQFRFEKTQTNGTVQNKEHHQQERISYGQLHGRLLEQYAPPSIVINEEYEIVHLSENAGRFLQIAGGEPTQNLLKLIKPELHLELMSALFQAVQRRSNVEVKNLRIEAGDTETVNIHVRPVLKEGDDSSGFILVLFEPVEDGKEETVILTRDEPVARQLEEELTRIKYQLRTSVEQHEFQSEELKASNEELQAMNEELRSATEELETSKEELQSINEELITVNQELKVKVEEVSLSGNNLQNLINSTDIGTLFLDRSFRVNMFTPAAREIFNLIPNDYGRPLSDITHKLKNIDLHADAETVINRLNTIEREVETTEETIFLMRISPYRTAEDHINGVVVTFVDITRRKQQEEEVKKLANQIEQQARIFNTTLTSISDFAYIFNREGRFAFSNKPLLDLLGITLKDITGKNFFDLNYPEDLATRLQKQIQHVFDTREIVKDETPFADSEGKQGYYEYIFTPVFAADGSTVEFVAGSTRDITARKLTEIELRSFQVRLNNAMKAGNIFSWEMNPETRNLEWSNNTETVLGFPLLRNIDKTFELIHPDDIKPTIDAINESIETGKLYESEYRLVNPANGDAFWMHSQGAVTNDTVDGQPRFVGITQNITTRKQAEEALNKSEERLRVTMESAADYAIITTNTEGLIEGWNSGAELTFGYTADEVRGKKADIVFTPEDIAAGIPEKEMKAAREEGRAIDERWHQRRDGTKFFMSGVMRPIYNPALTGYVKVARDITDQKLLEQQKDDFIGIASHELKTPVTSIKVYAEILQDLYEEKQITEGAELAGKLAQQVDRLVGLIRALLDTTIISHGQLKLVPEKFNINELITDQVEELKYTTNIHTLKHETEGDLFITADRRRMGEVFTNLISNAVKYSPRGGDIIITSSKTSEGIQVSIKDSGIGMAADVKDQVFQRFYRSSNPQIATFPGLGLGLYISASIIAMHKGRIWAESKPNEGATFYFVLPENP